MLNARRIDTRRGDGGVVVEVRHVEHDDVGVPELSALLNVTYQVPFLKGLSIDSQLNGQTNMLLNPRNGVTTPGYATLDLGFRYSFAIGKVPATLRGRIGNVFDEDPWTASRSETLNRVGPRAFRLSLTTNFSH
ncbi:MAG: hypothetical protein AB7E79_16200 [Rhodospirillaceae bacterium]